MTLLHADVLVMDQVTSFMSNDFAIRDQAGAQVGEIRTEVDRADDPLALPEGYGLDPVTSAAGPEDGSRCWGGSTT